MRALLSAHVPQVRRWMFFHTTTLSLLDALDGLAGAAEAALTAGHQQQSTHWWQRWRSITTTTSSNARSRQDRGGQKQQQVGEAPGHAGADIEAGVKLSSPQQQQQAQELELQPSSMLSSSDSANGLDRKPSPEVLGSSVSKRLGSQDAAAAADAAVSPPAHHHQQQQQRQVFDAQPVAASLAGGCAPQAQGAGSPQPPTPAAAAAGKAGQQAGGVTASVMKHTAWIRPWLPLALNLQQYENLKIVFSEDLPKALSSKKGNVTAFTGWGTGCGAGC
jgi:hypothetical protein